MTNGLKLLFALSYALFASPSLAGIIGTSGAVSVITPPSSVQEGDLEDDTAAIAFEEAIGATLGSDLGVDAVGSGAFDEVGDLTSGLISSGTVVESYFIHFDIVDAGTDNLKSISGSITFDHQILGVIMLSSTLDSSDWIGSPTLFPTGFTARQLELIGIEGTPDDSFAVSADLKTLSFQLNVNGSGLDQIRVLTAVPEPASAGLVLAGFVGLSISRRARLEKK